MWDHVCTHFSCWCVSAYSRMVTPEQGLLVVEAKGVWTDKAHQTQEYLGNIYSWEFSHDDSLADLGGYIRFMFFGFNFPGISASSHKIQCPSRVTEVVGCAEGCDSSPELTSISLRSFSQAQPQLRRFLWREAGAACVSLGGDCWVSAALMVSAAARRCPTPEIPASTSGICSVFLPPP